ncbi:hypothetical protein G6F22_013217 [Rhizopus arrhizus]|nr:hypothetical protein G6F22_013217 [Rhizopus arrhizus]KAG0910562.1 hypothetical protein G6F31_021547 [Rhizopus arrhizus]
MSSQALDLGLGNRNWLHDLRQHAKHQVARAFPENLHTQAQHDECGQPHEHGGAVVAQAVQHLGGKAQADIERQRHGDDARNRATQPYQA